MLMEPITERVLPFALVTNFVVVPSLAMLSLRRSASRVRGMC